MTTIPGMGTVLAATVLAEIGDVHRFPSADHLMSFCGLALSESQSGQSRQRRFLSRRGSARLRSAFYQAALLTIKYNRYLGAASLLRRTRPTIAREENPISLTCDTPVAF